MAVGLYAELKLFAMISLVYTIMCSSCSFPSAFLYHTAEVANSHTHAYMHSIASDRYAMRRVLHVAPKWSVFVCAPYKRVLILLILDK